MPSGRSYQNRMRLNKKEKYRKKWRSEKLTGNVLPPKKGKPNISASPVKFRCAWGVERKFATTVQECVFI